MASNKQARQVVDGKIRCGSKRHEGDRMVLLEDMPTKSTTPDGYDYACKNCHNAYNVSRSGDGYRKWKTKNPNKALWSGRRGDAKKRGIEFTITVEDVIIPEVCPVLGIPIVCIAGTARTDNSPSIDRIDNTKGYVPGNVVVTSWRANMLKKDATLNELQMLAKFYSELNNGDVK